jgi:hypothetical protein
MIINFILHNLISIPHAMAYTYFDTADLATTTMATTVSFVSDMFPILKIVISILLGGLVLTMLIGAFKK